MGDADDTYPLSELRRVRRPPRAAATTSCIGSRFKGTIHGDAMPFLNRFVGNPILTGMLNVLFGVKVSDAHCGMRAVRRDALPALDLHSTGMEFASEMVFKAYRRGLTVERGPDRLLPARRRVEAEPLRRRLAPRPLHAPVQPELAVPPPGSVLLLLGIVGMVVLAAGPDRHLRPHLADPHDARLRRDDAHRRAGDPARRLRADVRARADRRARPAARAARPAPHARARPPRRGRSRCSRGRRPRVGRRRSGRRTASARSAGRTRPRCS